MYSWHLIYNEIALVGQNIDFNTSPLPERGLIEFCIWPDLVETTAFEFAIEVGENMGVPAMFSQKYVCNSMSAEHMSFVLRASRQ